MKPYQDIGSAWKALKPFAPRRYEADTLPDPGTCPDAMIIINDRTDGVPRARLAISNGASWDIVAWANETKAPADVAPIVRDLVTRMLPAPIVQQPVTLPAVIQPTGSGETVEKLARALLELNQYVIELERRMLDEIDEIKRTAIGEARILEPTA